MGWLLVTGYHRLDLVTIDVLYLQALVAHGYLEGTASLVPSTVLATQRRPWEDCHCRVVEWRAASYCFVHTYMDR